VYSVDFDGGEAAMAPLQPGEMKALVGFLNFPQGGGREKENGKKRYAQSSPTISADYDGRYMKGGEEKTRPDYGRLGPI